MAHNLVPALRKPEGAEPFSNQGLQGLVVFLDQLVIPTSVGKCDFSLRYRQSMRQGGLVRDAFEPHVVKYEQTMGIYHHYI